MPTNFVIGAHRLIYGLAVDGPAPKGCAITVVRFDAPNETINPFGVILTPDQKGLRGAMSFDGQVNDYQTSTFTNK